MENSNDSWLIAVSQWLVQSRGERFPPALSETITTASGLELEQLIETILDSIDDLSLEVPDDDELENGLENGLDSELDSELEERAPASADASPTSDPARARALAHERYHEVQATQHRLRSLLQMIAARVLRLRLEQPTHANTDEQNHDSESVLSVAFEPVIALAEQLAGSSPLATGHCLQILAAQGDEQSLEQFVHFLKTHKLEDEQAIAVALSPLFQWPPPQLPELYAMFGEDLWQWQLLGPMLDLAGHSLRRGKLKSHPLDTQRARVRELLSATVGRLGRLAENPLQFGDDVPTIQRVLNNAISLTVSLCDTLGLIGDQQSEGQLNQALALAHRRVQTEAAGALARLGKPNGKERLIELAADPAARLRALTYIDELGVEDPQLAPWRQPAALAEAEVVAWLADRERFGVPPAELELIDERTQFWPSFEEPRSCFLFRFTYRFAGGDLSNIMIAGPMVYAFQADLRSMEPDDIYSLFAGWQAEHEEIYEVPVANFNNSQRAETQRLSYELDTQDIDQLQPLALTFFFGERALLALGQREGERVCTVTDGLETLVVPIDSRPTSFSPDLVLAMYRGRKLLRSFN